MENYLIQTTNYLLTQSWQIAVLVVVIAAVTWLLKNKSAHICYLLWLIVLAKCLVPPLLTVPVAILPQPEPPVLVETIVTLPAEPAVAPAAPVPSPPAPIVPEQKISLTGREWLAVIWIIGAVGFVLVAVIKASRTNSWLRRQRKPLPAKLDFKIEELFSNAGIGTFPKLWLVEGIGQPFVWGLLRGSIYLPADFVKVNNAEHRRGILGHELSHILRFDAAVNLLQVIAQAIFWFHPFVWWANKRIRAEREKCCDEMAIARLGAEAKEYSSAIVNILISEQESTRPVPSLAVAGPVKNIEERIKTMLRPGKKFYKHPSLPAVAIVVLTALLAVPTTVILTARAGEASIFGNPTNLGPTVNSSAKDFDPSISADEVELYFNSYRTGGLGKADLWVTTRKTKADPWGSPVNLGPTVNSPDGDKAPCISADGLLLYFSSGRSGGYGDQDLWVTTRKSKDAPWGEPVNLGPTVNSAADEHSPSISTDGLTLYFAEMGKLERPGGLGEGDIWVTTRKTVRDPWGTPVNLGPNINSPAWDQAPSISNNGLTLYFDSERGGGDESAIWVTTRKNTSDPWGAPVRFGLPINSSGWEADPDISRDGSTLYFVSVRPGGSGTSDLWQVSLLKHVTKE